MCVAQADVSMDKIPRCPVCTGVVKPDIVFFGETLPQRFLLHVLDFPMADLLLILGTSLEVCQQVQWWTECAGGRGGYKDRAEEVRLLGVAPATLWSLHIWRPSFGR